MLVGEHAEIPGCKLAEQLRDAWPDLGVQINLGGGSFKTQFKRADKSGADLRWWWGMTKLARGVVAMKALRREAGAGRVPHGTNQ